MEIVFVITAQAGRMILFGGRSSGGKCWFVGWVSWETFEVSWITTTQDGWMTMINNDKDDDHDGHHCCKCGLMISWPNFRWRPCFFMQSFMDIWQGHQVWKCYRMTLDPRYSIWANFTLFCQVKGTTCWSWSMQHLNSSFFQCSLEWPDVLCA